MKITYFTLLFILLLGCSSDNSTGPIDNTPDSLYFPPIINTEWETLDASTLGWENDDLENLYAYLEEKNTKGFMIIKDGKIVVEQYFNSHTQNAVWPWYSAAKSLTATAIGVAQEEGFLNINDKTSDYLGNNWSSLTQEQQDLITIKHHMMMNSGLESNIGNIVAWTCTLPACLTYSSDAGDNWAYHQGAFILAQDMLTESTNMNFQPYIKDRILDNIGVNGSWSSIGFLNIFSSNTRGLARFGLLSLNKGTWDENEIVSESYFNEMTNTSQQLNKAYGYLWWLNGKESFVGTDSSTYTGSLVPNAPNDMFAALGAQDQKIYVIPSENMVVVRSGDSAGNTEFAASSFDNELWEKINAVIN